MKVLAKASVLAALLLGVSVGSSSGASARRVGLLGVVPHRGAPRLAARSLAAAAPSPDDVVYHGGWVMHTNTVYVIYWVPAGQTVQTGYETAIDRYFSDVAAASGQSDNVYATDTQYYDTTNGDIAYASTFGGSYLDTTPFSAAQCDDGVDPVCLTDSQIQTEIQNAIAANGWPTGETSLFFLLTPQHVGVCSGNDCSSNDFCAYHSGFTAGGVPGGAPVVYAVQPYAATVDGCHGGYGEGSPNGDDADAAINTISHEQNEAITDPWGDAWYDLDGDEIADICAWQFGTPLGTASNGQPYNQLINGDEYSLQEEWSNGGSTCGLEYPAGASALPASPTSLALPVVSGTAAVGRPLETTAGVWTGSPTGYAYEWQRCKADGSDCVTIPGADGSSYQLASADAGDVVRAEVSATNAGGSSGLASSQPTGVVAPVPATTTGPVVSGVPAVRRTLSASEGTWNTPASSFSYRWLRCSATGCAAIAGADSSTYRLVRADAGHTLEAQVSATNAAGTTAAASAATGVVVAEPAAATTPRISGRARVGRALTVRARWMWSPTSYRYQWLRCSSRGRSCVRIRRATHLRYRLRKPDSGHRLRVRVSATNLAGSVTVTSRSSARVPGRHGRKHRR